MKRYFKKKVLFGAVILFVLFNIGSYVIHQVLLSADYRAQDKLWRPDMADKMWIFQIIFLVQAYFLSFLFSRGYEGRGWIEGLRFGVILGLLIEIPAAYGMYAILPIPYWLALKSFVFGLIEITAAGLALGFIFQKK